MIEFSNKLEREHMEIDELSYFWEIYLDRTKNL